MNNYKILMINLGYARGWNGSFTSLLKHLYRFPYQSFSQRKEELEKLRKIIKKEDPDLILIPEIRDKKCLKYLSKLGYPFHDMNIKYGPKSLYRKIPTWHNNANAFLSKEKIEFKIKYLKNGAKKLIYELVLPDKKTYLYFAHFSLLKGTRKLQFQEVSNLSHNKERKIVAGDFNILSGVNELNELLEEENLKISSIKNTYPSYKPKKALDLFLIPKNWDAKTKVFYKEDMSDHLPVIIEINKSLT